MGLKVPTNKITKSDLLGWSRSVSVNVSGTEEVSEIYKSQ